MQLSLRHLNTFFNQPLSLDKVQATLNKMGAEVERTNQADDDHIIDIEVTPNRADWFSYYGVAREIVAGLEDYELFKKPEIKKYSGKSPVGVSVSLKAASDCPQYYLAKIDNTHVQQLSDSATLAALTNSGFSQFNHIVDIINLAMAEYGQPMHAIDADKVVGNIVVRNAKANEEIVALDGKTYLLQPTDIIISDEADNPIAIGGVMGAKYAEVTNSTKNILLECAYFDPITVRKTVKRLGLSSESARRFEMGLDPEGLQRGLAKVIEYILEVNGDFVGVAVHDQHKTEKRILSLPWQRLNNYLGIEIDQDWASKTLTNLGFAVTQHDRHAILAEVPSWRLADVKYDVCLIEELAKVYDFNKLPSIPPAAKIIRQPKNYWLQFKRLSEEFFINQGFCQALNFGFIAEDDIQAFQPKKNSPLSDMIWIEKPLNNNFTILRNTQLPGLIKNLNANIDRHQEEIRLFELGRIFLKDNKKIVEQRTISGILYGPRDTYNWQTSSSVNNFHDLKAVVFAFIHASTRQSAENFHLRNQSLDFYQTDSSCEIFCNEQRIGHMGELKNKTIHKKAAHPVFSFELNMDKLIEVRNQQTSVYKEPSRFPSIVKDFAFIVDQGFESQNIIDIIYDIGKDLIKSVRLFDVYSGKPIPKGQESLAYNIEFNSNDRSLTHDEVNGLFEKMINTLRDRYQLQLRDA